MCHPVQLCTKAFLIISHFIRTASTSHNLQRLRSTNEFIRHRNIMASSYVVCVCVRRHTTTSPTYLPLCHVDQTTNGKWSQHIRHHVLVRVYTIHSTTITRIIFPASPPLISTIFFLYLFIVLLQFALLFTPSPPTLRTVPLFVHLLDFVIFVQ